MATKILRKLSVKTVVGLSVKGLRDLAATGKGAPVPLIRLAGIARKAEIGESDNGEFVRFKGDFQGVDLRTGEISISPVAFLPAPVDAMLQAAIQADEKGNGAQFGFDILIVENETSAVGYEYRVQTLLEVKPTAPLEALLASLPPAQIAAPAPAAAITQEPASEAVPDKTEAPEPVKAATGGKKK